MGKRQSTVIDLSGVPFIVASYYGVDLHKDQITWHRIDWLSDGTIHRANGKTAAGRIFEDFTPHLDTERDYLIVEASGSTFFFYTLVAEHCKQAIIVNPAAFRELYMSGKKTDRVDAKKLADRLMYHIEMNDADDGFPQVFIPDETAIQVRELVTTYELIVKQTTQIKNQLKAIFRAKLIPVIADVLEEGLEHALDHPRIDAADRRIAQSLKALYDTLCAEKQSMKEAILDIGITRFRGEVELLTSINGIGIFGAIVFMADVVTVDRFKSAKKLTSYLASVGKVDSSGTVIRDGGLNKRGRRTSYRHILQGLEHVVNGNDNFRRFRDKHRSKRANKVRAAIVRKTFVAMYYMLKINERYRFVNETVHRRKSQELNRIITKSRIAA